MQLAGQTQLLHLGRVSGMELSLAQHLWVGDWLLLPWDSCSTGAPAQALFPVQHQTLSLWGSQSPLWLYFGANLIRGNQLISFTVCKADWQDSAEKMSLNFQLIFHTHSLPPPPAILVATITRNKLINKQLLFQTRHNFYYYFNFIQRIYIGKFPAQSSQTVLTAGIFLETKSANVCGTALGILLECAVAQQLKGDSPLSSPSQSSQ